MPRMKKQCKQGPRTLTAEKNDNFPLLATALLLLVIGALVAASLARNSIYRAHVTLWKDITERSPNKRRAHENYGQALSTAGSVAASEAEARQLYFEALREFQTVISLKDDGSVPLRDLYREIGVVYFRLGLFDDAISSWRTGLRHAPYDPSLLNNLSIALMQKGLIDEAAASAETALRGDPNMPQALNTLGQVYMAKGDFEKASGYFQKALEREPDVPARYWNIALAMEQAKKYDLALWYANKYEAMERNPAGRQRARQFLMHLRQVSGK